MSNFVSCDKIGDMEELMKKVLVVGGGPSGLVAAIFASESAEVTVMERNSSCGKKLLLTGNGKCNYWNEDQDIKHYHSNNDELLKEIIKEEHLKETFDFLSSIGIVPFIKNGYYYPFSNQAATMKNALMKKALKNKVAFFYDTLILSIEKIKSQFFVKTNQGDYFFDSVILANGGKTYSKTGSDGNGYRLLEELGHTIIPPLPSLVALETKGDFLKKWHGIRTNVTVSFQGKVESGEIQLTDYGVSGICIFNLSREASFKNDNTLMINFLPFTNKPIAFFNGIFKNQKDYTIGEILDNILNCKLVAILLLKSNISYNVYPSDLSEFEFDRLIKTLTHFELEVVGMKSFDQAQVTAGGLSLLDVKTDTLESKRISNLYIVGELLDIDGDCGGYNLTNAFVTGMLAGKGVAYDSN